MDWLDRHLSALAPRGSRILELGCGPGRDAARLAVEGFEVVATDSGLRALARASAAVGTGSLLRVDHGRPLPFRDAAFDALVASLTLHYFSRTVTQEAFREVRRVLRAGGGFLFRVNATDDVEHGANDGVEIERNVRTDPHEGYSDIKHFFDEDDIREVLDGLFEVETLEHLEIERNDRVKRVWECRARAS